MRVHRVAAWLLISALAVACARQPEPDPVTPSGPDDPPPVPPVVEAPFDPAEEPTPPPVSTAPRPATVTVDQRYGDTWKPVTVMDAYAAPGPSAVRLTFSKLVNRQEVEAALLAAQSAPIRGLMEWTDAQTLTWQIAELPPRLDFLLGGAHDADGLPLPGGIPSLRLGEPPTLVEVDLAGPADAVLGTMPPDIVTVRFAREAGAVNLLAWTPGATKWDWQTVDIHFDLAQRALKRGWAEEDQPRIPGELSDGSVSPNGLAVAGLVNSSADGSRADLVVRMLRGSRAQTFPGAVVRPSGGSQVDQTTYLAWSPDSAQVAFLSYAGDPQRSELVVVEPAAAQRTVLIPDLPVPAQGTRLTWSPDGRWLLAGSLLIDALERQVKELAAASQATGIWEPGGSRLLFSTADWGQVLVMEPNQGAVTPLGEGMIVGWSSPGKVLVIRWPGNATRYLPPGS